MKPNRNMSSDAVPVAKSAASQVVANHAVTNQEAVIVLKAVSHPELGDIRIDEVLFAIGRDEPPFNSYAPDIVADLSRRHARIFCEYGSVYLADLESKNGTTINGLSVKHKISRLQNDDEINFGRTLTYRVRIGNCLQTPQRAAKLACLTLTPERNDTGLQPIAITQFPFLISKTDEIFARYKDACPQQVNYISRRHAHIFLKGGVPFVEDLGSTNGTFVNGNRLDEHAVVLKDGDLLAFGGHHFVYKLHLQKEEQLIDPTVTMLSPLAAGAAGRTADTDKTTFVAAAGSFLDIFCVDPAPQADAEANNEVAQETSEITKDADKKSRKNKTRSRFSIFLSELATAFSGNERSNMRHILLWCASFAILIAMLASVLYLNSASERRLQSLVDEGNYAEAAKLADAKLEHDPDNVPFKALGSEALLKAYVPKWLTQLKTRNYAQAGTTLTSMTQLARHNADVQALIGELDWMGRLEQFVIGRGGMEAPIGIYADEDKIKALLARWNDNTQGHQRALDSIATTVPQFKDPYAEALSHVRKLQSDDAVYLPAIDRLKTSVNAELNADRPEALEALLKDYAEKYPRMGGLDKLRQDMRQYMAIDNAVRTKNLAALNTLLTKTKMTTPPFQAKLNGLKSSNRFPPADVLAQYQTVSQVWQAGDTQQAFAGLQSMAAGPWADAAAKQLEQKKTIAEQFSALKKSRGDKGYDERLLAFYGSLDPDEDKYFMHAAEADMGQYKEKALGQARELLTRAQTLWQQYQKSGPIEGTQRLDSVISNQFRSKAQLLSEANQNVQQGQRIYTQLKMEQPSEWRKSSEEIKNEIEQQRAALMQARDVLEPRLFKAKLALLGGQEK
jgi:pSer/pThr/pTyr-binding forkhead associated (FHA) protein